MHVSYQTYDSYKDSGIPWLGNIPNDWGLIRNKAVFSELKDVVGKNASKYKLLSLTLKGVIPRDMENPKGKFPAEFDAYKKVSPNNIVFCLFDIEETPRTVGHAYEEGMITGAYTVTCVKPHYNSRFVNYYYLSLDFNKKLKPLYTGLRNVIKKDTFFSIKMPLPDRDKQDRIVAFLDRKAKEIDEAIAKKEQLIELLKEQKAILINQTVTKGLNPDVSMKDSGIDWIGEIPAHWELKKLRTFADFVTRGTTPEYVDSSDYAVVNQATFSKGFWDLESLRYTSCSNLSRTKGLLKDKDVLVASTGGGVLGKVYLFTKEDEQIYIADSHVTIIRDSKSRFVPEYLYACLSENFTLIENTLGQGATNQTELQRNWLRNMLFPLPPLEEQHSISRYTYDYCQQWTRQSDIVHSEIEKLKEYKQALIAHAVTGKIKV